MVSLTGLLELSPCASWVISPATGSYKVPIASKWGFAFLFTSNGSGYEVLRFLVARILARCASFWTKDYVSNMVTTAYDLNGYGIGFLLNGH